MIYESETRPLVAADVGLMFERAEMQLINNNHTFTIINSDYNINNNNI